MKRVILLTVLVCLLGVVPAHAYTWSISDRAPGNLYQYHGFAVDGNGRSHVSFEVSNNNVGVRYLDSIPGAWGIRYLGGNSGIRDNAATALPNGDVLYMAEDGGDAVWYSYDSGTGTWSGRTPMGQNFDNFSITASSGGLVAAAGQNGSRQLTMAYKPVGASSFSFVDYHNYGSAGGDSDDIIILGQNSIWAIDDTHVGIISQRRRSGPIDLFTGSYNAGTDTWTWQQDAVGGTSHGSYFQKGALGYYGGNPYVVFIDNDDLGARRGVLKLAYRDGGGTWHEMVLDGTDGLSPDDVQLSLYRGSSVSLDIEGRRLVVAYSYIEANGAGETRLIEMDLGNMADITYDVIADGLGDRDAYTQQLVQIVDNDFYVHMRGQFANSYANATYVARTTADTWLATGPIPEPATLTLLGLGLAGVASRLRRRRSN